MWKYNEDTTKPIITAKAHIESGHKSGCEQTAFNGCIVLYARRHGLYEAET